MAAALVLTACSGSGSDESTAGDETSSPETSAAATESADTGGSTAEADGVEGSWLATKGGKAVALVINDGQAGLFSTGGSVCNGTARETSGMQMIALKCTDGNEDRAEGMVDSVNSTTMKVTWEGFGEETYTRSEGGKLPSGLPTASLGS
nr:hypothetical protein [Streptomyces scabichelini]